MKTSQCDIYYQLNYEVFFILGIWRSHDEYQLYLINNMLPFYNSNKITVEFYSKALTKLYIFNLDTLKALLKPCFSTTGKPSNHQPEMFLSFILITIIAFLNG